jgi:hypothetical protein
MPTIHTAFDIARWGIAESFAAEMMLQAHSPVSGNRADIPQVKFAIQISPRPGEIVQI